jgi:hypothetical protein
MSKINRIGNTADIKYGSEFFLEPIIIKAHYYKRCSGTTDEKIQLIVISDI